MSFPSPFDHGEVHPAARAAAEALMAELRAGLVPRALVDGPEGGKMFGVLVAEGGAVLRAFSGLLGGKWVLDGFVPPVFDLAAREHIEVPGEKTVKALTARHAALESAPELAALRGQVKLLRTQHAAALEALELEHRSSKQDRAKRREGATPAQLEALAQESRRDKAAYKWLLADQANQLAAPAAQLAKWERRLRASDRLRAFVSRRLMQQLHDTYAVPNFRGESKPLRALSRGGEPPSGAGDCAAPKLLAAAARRGLRPIAMAEFWWGASPPRTARTEGEFAPACRHKCGWLLPFMLEGLEVAAPRGLGAEAPAALKVLYRDAHLLAVEKPEGLLSVPGRVEALVDSVQSRLRAEFPAAQLVHRLDLDTSGVLLVALDEQTHRGLQAQFAARTVDKRYVAWLCGEVERDAGRIELPLRVDLEDRPRQIHDPVHGRHAVTTFRVLERRGARTRVEFRPLTGRTHQLRVHASHALGLGAPIEGDRLYGARGPRLMLHAESISFTHPATGKPTTVRAPAEF